MASDSVLWPWVAWIAVAVLAALISLKIISSRREYRFLNFIGALVAMAVSVLAGIGFVTKTLEPKAIKTSDLSTQIRRLDEVGISLKDLQEFVQQQKKRLHDAENTIRELQIEKDKLEPLVEADRKTVEAIFAHFEEKSRRNAWTERLIGFISGILASLIGTVIIRMISTKIRAGKPFKVFPKLAGTPSAPSVIFSDDIEEFIGWNDFKRGTLSQVSNLPHSGTFSLRKERFNDPHGGYKIMEKPVQPPFVFSGWLNRPTDSTGGAGDRLAIEDSSFNGYGFAINHNNNKVWIERRDGGAGKERIGSTKEGKVPKGEWYRFEFYVRPEGNMELKLYNADNEEIIHIDDASDTKYSEFDRVAIHGGHTYYIDDIKVERE